MVKLTILLGFLAIAWLCSTTTSHAATQATYYVSPTGNDSNPGTLAQPFKTIAKARNVVRTINSSMTGDIIVNLRAGDYFQSSTIEFNESDSGTNGYQVIYRNYDAPGSARIIGGEKLTGWTLDSGNIYKTYVGTSWSFDALFENGESSRIARHPNTGYKKIKEADSSQPKKAFYYFAGDIPSISDISNLQVYVWPGAHNWANEILPITAINTTTRKITLSQNQRWDYLDTLKKGSRYFIQGARELLDQPGEFYLDKAAGYLYYYPVNANINSQEIIAPRVSRTILLNGSSNTNRVKNITFDGVTVMVSNSTYAEMNSGRTGNIVIINAENITVKNSRILNSASNGISYPSMDLQSTPVKSRGMNGLIYGNYIHNIGESGVKIYGIANTLNYMQTDHLVSNNEVSDIARISTNGAGIQFSNTTASEASYNKITNATHYGIEVKGSKWTQMPNVIEGVTVTTANRYNFNPGRYNVIQFNDVSKVNMDAQDTGMIKTGGVYKTTIHNNLLHDSGSFGAQKGLYLDDVSDYNTVTNNIVYGTKLNTTYNVKGTGNLIQNNIADGTGGAAAVSMNVISGQPTLNNTFLNNIFYKYKVFYNFLSWSANMVSSSNYNTFYSPSGTRTMNNIPGSDTYAHWKQLFSNKYDQNSTTADPQFVNAAAHNYTLQPTSPMLAKGFNQIDTSAIGLKSDYIYADSMADLSLETSVVEPDPEPAFYEGFENGFGEWQTLYGTPTASTTQAHTDVTSFIPDEGQDEIYHVMDGETFGVLTIWFYDNASDTSMKTRARITDTWTDENAMIGVVTYNSTTKYSYMVDNLLFKTSSVNRTTGWHEFKFDVSSGIDCKLYIDGTLIATTDVLTSFNQIHLGDNADDGNTGNVYFDDVTLYDTFELTD
ncbi:hypothetical protein [Paenibacillus koleovorans]|uniref:hypothetical protein n=1 Tax=Paenibacillus koleovorans TaxID=121608 RepID=UPI000FD73AE7|nr:hypothetical protein [Paenibacillus koleovorans]